MDKINNTLAVLEPIPSFDSDNNTHEDRVARSVAADARALIKPTVVNIFDRTTFAPSTVVRIWKQAERGYIDIVDELDEALVPQLADPHVFAGREIMDVFKDKAVGWEPTAFEELPELESGEQRMFFDNYASACAFIEAALSTNATCIRFMTDGRWAVDVVAEGKYLIDPLDA